MKTNKMIYEKEIIDFLNKQYPLKNAETWDFVGYSIKTPSSESVSILFCLDVTLDVVNKAIKNKYNLIISFHPLLFAETWKDQIELAPYKKIIYEKCVKNNINVFSMHTNYEKEYFSSGLSILKQAKFDISIIQKNDYMFSWENNITTKKVIKKIKKNLDLSYVLTNSKNKLKNIPKRIYFLPGAGDINYFMNHPKAKEEILLITSDLKWHDQLLLNENGIDFLLIPHDVEKHWYKELLTKVLNSFPKLKYEIYQYKNIISSQ